MNAERSFWKVVWYGGGNMVYQAVKTIICDDHKETRNQIYNYLEEFGSNHFCEFDIHTFASSGEMMHSSALEECELLFLDIEMGEPDGIEVSRILRNQQGREEIQIIFISAYDRYMKDMFEARPFYYLSKPFSKDKFFYVVDKFLSLYKKYSGVFSFKTGRETYRLPYKEILYFESVKRKIIIHAKGGSLDFYGKLDELEGDLNKNSFFRIHQSYLVNPMHIKLYSARSVTLVNGLEIPISTKYRKTFLQMQIV